MFLFGINYDLMAANCMCDSNYLQFDYNNEMIEESKDYELVNFKTITKSFISNLLDFNIEVIYCYNLAFDKKILIKNIGFYSLALMFLLQTIFMFMYIIKKLKTIKTFMLFLNINNKNKVNNFNINNKKTNNPPPPKHINLIESFLEEK